MDNFVAIDVEIASRSPLRVCAIGAVRVEHRRETGSLCALTRVDGPVHFTRIHGLTAADLADAPPWPVVWNEFLGLLGEMRLVVAFRAAFDRSAILTMCARDRIRAPSLRFLCAAVMIEAACGRMLSLYGALEWLGAPFPGRPHDPLADARAAATIALACAPAKTVQLARVGAIPLSKNPAHYDRAKSR